LVRELVENGPFYFSMQVKDDFKSYSGGVYRNATAKSVGGHAVKVVGYGFEQSPLANPEPLDNWYWIVQNSWGPRFGESGFFRIAMSENIAYLASALTPVNIWGKRSIASLLNQ
jgi:cathepsin B